MVVCPIRLQKWCEIFIACVSANGSRPEHGPESVIRCDGCHPAPWLFYHEARAISGHVWHGFWEGCFRCFADRLCKSLCYACPPTVFGLVLPVEGTSIVFAVAPLTAIMEDQVSSRAVAHTCGHKRGIMLHNNYIPQRIIAFRVDKSMY